MSDFTKRVEILTNLFENNKQNPSVDAVAEAITEAYYLGVYSADSQIQHVRELHKPFVMAPNCTLCDHCWDAEAENYYEYPCPTIKALEGELDE